MKQIQLPMAVDSNNWKVDNNYIQTLPKALDYAGIEDESLLRLYNESLEAFRSRNTTEKTSIGEYVIHRESGTLLYSRNRDRLFLLPFEASLKQHTIQTGSITKSLQNIIDNAPLTKKSFGGKR